MRNNSFPLCGLPRALFVAVVTLTAVDGSFDLAAGTLYVAERSNGNVVAVDTVSGQARVAASGLGSLIGAAVDRRGRLFVHRWDARAVALVNPADNSFVNIATSVDGHGLWAAPDSDTLYLAGFEDRVVYRIREQQSDSWVVDVVAEDLPSPVGVLLDGRILYVADRSGRLYAQHLDTGNLELIVNLPAGGEMVSREAGGDLIIGTVWGPVCRVNAAQRRLVQTYTGFSNPAGVVVDPKDNSVLVCEHNGHKITRLNLTTGQRSLLTSFVEVPYQPTFAKEVTLPLTIQTPVLTGNILTLSWTGGPGVKLQKTTDLTNPAWQDVSGSDGLSSLILPVSGTSEFFRAVKP